MVNAAGIAMDNDLEGKLPDLFHWNSQGLWVGELDLCLKIPFLFRDDIGIGTAFRQVDSEAIAAFIRHRLPQRALVAVAFHGEIGPGKLEIVHAIALAEDTDFGDDIIPFRAEGFIDDGAGEQSGAIVQLVRLVVPDGDRHGEAEEEALSAIGAVIAGRHERRIIDVVEEMVDVDAEEGEILAVALRWL